MPRYKLSIEYDGAEFVGWQRQDNGPSVQQALETALGRFAGEPVTLHTAGRTDAGVHALAQVAHFDMVKEMPQDKVRDAVNFHLGDAAVAVLQATLVEAEFHARFSATGRHYLYRIVDRRPPLALDRGRVWRVGRDLDAAAMDAAAQVLTGKHDFTTFRAAQCQAKSPLRTLDTITVRRRETEIVVAASARSFLHHQVRSMVGSLVEVGCGRWTAQDLGDALAAADRRRCGPVAPAHGLYLKSVSYD